MKMKKKKILKIEVEFHVHPTVQGVRRSYTLHLKRGHGQRYKGGKVNAWSSWDPTKLTNKSKERSGEIHISNQLTLETLGHEFYHLIVGHFHDPKIEKIDDE